MATRAAGPHGPGWAKDPLIPKADPNSEAAAAPSSTKTKLGKSLVFIYSCIVGWIVVSSMLVMTNKYILSNSGFNYPMALAILHMASNSVLSWILVRSGLVDCPKISASTYLRAIAPIGAWFAVVLWAGNMAYILLSVAFIQMLKAAGPICMLVVGIALGTERYSHRYLANVLTVSLGVGLASYGELNFNVTGTLLQLGALILDALRCQRLQMVLQKEGLQMNALALLYYLAPVSLACLLVPFAIYELPRMLAASHLAFNWPLLAASAFAAFLLNILVFVLIGSTSALTTSMAGILKDWICIASSVVVFQTEVTQMQVVGYGVALCGVVYYQRQKFFKK